MKITNVVPHLLTAYWVDDPWFPQTLHSTVVVRIETDAKLHGLGEMTVGYFAPETVPAMVEYFRPVLIGTDPLQIALRTRSMFDDAVWWARSGAGRSVISGIELALWDLKGKALGVPVYQLLGGAARDRIRVYASGGTTCWPIEESVRKVAFYAKNEYRATKLSTDLYELPPASDKSGLSRLRPVKFPFSSKLEELAKCFDRLRSEFGGEMDLAVDGHQGGVPDPISISEAVDIDNALSPYRLRFYEEPLSYINLDGYRELRARARIPIAGGESLCGLDGFHPLISQQAVQLVQPDIGFVGGLQETVRILHHAEGYNIGTAIHTGASMGPSFAASWHLAAATASVEWLERVPAARAIQDDLLVDRFELKNGQVGLPSSPGFGVTLTAELLEKYRFVPGAGERT